MPQALNHDFSIKKPFLSDQTIDQLLKQGYIGVDRKLANDTAFGAAAHKFKEQIKWTETYVDGDGDIALMTLNLPEFDQLLQFMLDSFGWCPPVYSDTESPDIFIFTPEDELQQSAIFVATDGDYGWKGSLYSLEYFDSTENQNILGFIFATKPKDSDDQDWLLVEVDRLKNSRGWSLHSGTIEQVYYIWAERIGIPEPNFKPTSDEILDALASNPQDSSTKKTIGMTFTAPPELEVGDEVETTTLIRLHDIVCWERVAEHKWIMRALSPQEVSTYKGRKFQIDKGDEASTVKYIEIE